MIVRPFRTTVRDREAVQDDVPRVDVDNALVGDVVRSRQDDSERVVGQTVDRQVGADLQFGVQVERRTVDRRREGDRVGEAVVVRVSDRFAERNVAVVRVDDVFRGRNDQARDFGRAERGR